MVPIKFLGRQEPSKHPKALQHERWHVLKHRRGLAELIFGTGGRELTVTIDHLPMGTMRLAGSEEALTYISRESHCFDWPTKSNR